MEPMGVWQDFEASESGIVEVARKLGLSDTQLRVLGKRQWMPRALESADWLIVNFLVPSVSHGVLRTSRISVLVGADRVVTIHSPHDSVMSQIRERVELSPRISLSPTGILAVVADVVTEQFTPVLDYVDTAVDNIEDVMIKHPTDRQLHELFHYKKVLVDLRKVVLPTTAVLDALSDGRYVLVRSKYASYLRDSYDYSWRAHELIDTLRDLLTSALDTYLSVVSNRLNDVMKRLTMVATIFMPISFVVGFGGMNFIDYIPFSSPVFFGFILAVIILTPLLMLAYFHKKKWL